MNKYLTALLTFIAVFLPILSFAGYVTAVEQGNRPARELWIFAGTVSLINAALFGYKVWRRSSGSR